MEWQLVIAINVMMISAITVLMAIISRQQVDRSMLLGHVLVIAAGGLALFFDYRYAGALVSLIFVPIVLVPGLLMHCGTRAYLLARYPEAKRYARWAKFSHPSGSMRFRADLLCALSQDDTDAICNAILGLLSRADGHQKASLEATIERLKGHWHEVLGIIREAPSDSRGLQELEIRALGELGRTDEMVHAYEDYKSQLAGLSLQNAQMFLLAFCGRPDAIEMLRSARRPRMHPDFLEYWHAVATYNARGLRLHGRAMLEQLAAHSSLEAVRFAALNYLAQRTRREPAYPSAGAAAVANVVAGRWHEAGALGATPLLRSKVTLALVLANSIMFVLEDRFGGIEDADALMTLGAIWPPLIVNGEWWRLGSALFLHFGWAHFLLNMTSLIILGRLVEGVFGSSRMLAIYGLGGIGSMSAVFAMMQMGVSAADFVVGASGAIMSLFGAWAGRLLLRWLKSRDHLDRQPAILMAIIVAVQSAVDLSVPQISFTGHISGFVIGFLLSLVFVRVSATSMLNGR